MNFETVIIYALVIANSVGVYLMQKYVRQAIKDLRNDAGDYKEVMELRYRRERKDHLQRHTLLSGDVFALDCRITSNEERIKSIEKEIKGDMNKDGTPWAKDRFHRIESNILELQSKSHKHTNNGNVT